MLVLSTTKHVRMVNNVSCYLVMLWAQKDLPNKRDGILGSSHAQALSLKDERNVVVCFQYIIVLIEITTFVHRT